MIAIFPRLAEAAAKGDLETLSCLVRLYFAKNNPFAPQLDLNEVYKHLTIPIKNVAIDGIAVLACRDEGGRFSVTAILNPRRPDGSGERFLLAHLLGHFFLHVQPQILRGEWQTRGIGIDQNPENQYTSYAQIGTDDSQANDFAAALLLPKSQLRKAAAAISEEGGLSKFFGVNPAVVRRRLQALDGQPQPKAVAPSEKRAKGMERLREIAKNLDKGM